MDESEVKERRAGKDETGERDGRELSSEGSQEVRKPSSGQRRTKGSSASTRTERSRVEAVAGG